MHRHPCLFCSSRNVSEVLDLGCLPAIQGSPVDVGDLGKEVYGNFVLGRCGDCGHVYNCAVESSVVDSMYFEGYTSALPQSPAILQRFNHVAEVSIGREIIRNSRIVEIGASDFSFSKILIACGAERVWAFEPSTLFSNAELRIEHRKKYFDLTSAEDLKTQGVNLVIARHVLEHMTSPRECLTLIRDTLPIGGHVYLEVPNLFDILEKQRVYDFFYEHVSYFTPDYLSRVLGSLGFEILILSSLVENQHFGFLAKKVSEGPIANSVQEGVSVASGLNRLSKSFSVFKTEFMDCLDRIDRPAIYGAGNHAIGVTNILKLRPDRVKFLLDQNPFKVGKYSPGSHIPIEFPTQQKLETCDGIIILASLHQPEIHWTLRNQLGYKKRIFGTHPVVEELE